MEIDKLEDTWKQRNSPLKTCDSKHNLIEKSGNIEKANKTKYCKIQSLWPIDNGVPHDYFMVDRF